MAGNKHCFWTSFLLPRVCGYTKKKNQEQHPKQQAKRQRNSRSQEISVLSLLQTRDSINLKIRLPFRGVPGSGQDRKGENNKTTLLKMQSPVNNCAYVLYWFYYTAAEAGYSKHFYLNLKSLLLAFLEFSALFFQPEYTENQKLMTPTMVLLPGSARQDLGVIPKQSCSLESYQTRRRHWQLISPVLATRNSF